MREYYVYILRCEDGSYYTGVTNDHQCRVNDHQRGYNQSAYTYKRRPVKLVYLATFTDINEAIDWEKRVKRWTRKKKEALIQGRFEDLQGLALNAYAKRICALIVMVRRAHHDNLQGEESYP